MTLSLLEFLEQHETIDRAAVDAFLAAHPSPILEGKTLTFLYRGEADAVFLRHFVYGLPPSPPFQRIPGSDLWYLSLEVPHHSRIEYKLEVFDRGGRRLLRDPLNPRLAHDPFGANSVCHGGGYEVPPWTQPDPEARAGTVEEVVVPAAAPGGERRVSVYLPARLRAARRCPLLVVFDGEDYLKFASLKTVLDNLIHRHEMTPTIVAMSQAPNRFEEYGASEPHARWVAEGLVPFLETRYPLRPDAGHRGLMGASLGAVASLSCAWRHPGTFGRLLLQSGSFVFSDVGRKANDPVMGPVLAWMDEFRAVPGKPADRLFLSCGVYESLIYENRSLVPFLQSTGMEVRYVEARDGHNWENWRDRLREGLTWLFPGPVGLVYE